ncbi:transposase [Niabella drilacis]|uniref:Transposase IS200 like n=1 Tax=Niabella drilacis (strain DSM 25811 / CCM 8410 / CCUG 62505 / LMG 26954 / E90) TaxID=1285928 RepID=A0A1G6UPM1_NIADE|nr:transposase [Niabella drilacis]SDD42497.1 Transposase IS200 like [Niabella drilacis]
MLHFETYYHIYNHANGDDNLFREAENYNFFLKKYHQHLDPVVETIAWCLMPNHFHLLVKIKSEEAVASTFLKFQTLEKFEQRSAFLSKQFSNFFSSYTQSFNKVYKRRGSLFIKNFKRKEVTDEAYLRSLILYIHLNPVKHGFVKEMNSWFWTSLKTFPDAYPDLAKQLFTNFEQYNISHQNKQIYFEEYTKLENDLI